MCLVARRKVGVTRCRLVGLHGWSLSCPQRGKTEHSHAMPSESEGSWVLLGQAQLSGPQRHSRKKVRAKAERLARHLALVARNYSQHPLAEPPDPLARLL